jgi:hypothetical protein
LKARFSKPRDAVDYIMDTFPIVKRKDEAAYGSYRTKEKILEIYDEMQEAVRVSAGSAPPVSVSCGPSERRPPVHKRSRVRAVVRREETRYLLTPLERTSASEGRAPEVAERCGVASRGGEYQTRLVRPKLDKPVSNRFQ